MLKKNWDMNNLHETIRRILKEETEKLINKIVRRIPDLDDVVRKTTDWAMVHYDSRLDDVSDKWFVETVIFNVYIDEISPIFEKWDEHYDGPFFNISKSDEDNIQRFLAEHYFDVISKRFNKRYKDNSLNESDPKVGTGKKPKGSDRRLYTDENPKDTVSVKFRTKQDVIDTLSKESFKSKSHARQSQIINLIHQRLRVALQRAKDTDVKKRLRTAFEYIEMRKEASKRKTQEMKESEITERCWKGYTQKGMKTMFGKRYPNCVKKKK
jgi:hypothetical protein